MAQALQHGGGAEAIATPQSRGEATQLRRTIGNAALSRKPSPVRKKIVVDLWDEYRQRLWKDTCGSYSIDVPTVAQDEKALPESATIQAPTQPPLSFEVRRAQRWQVAFRLRGRIPTRASKPRKPSVREC